MTEPLSTVPNHCPTCESYGNPKKCLGCNGWCNHVPSLVPSEPKLPKTCLTCQHFADGYGDKVCDVCNEMVDKIPFAKWKPVEAEQPEKRYCLTCRHEHNGCGEPTCKDCVILSDKMQFTNWQPIEPKQPQPEQIGNPNRNISEDPINSPAHYQHGGIETIDIIRSMLTADEYRGYLKGNILKYRERAPYKGKTDEDYAKAKKYHDWLMEVTPDAQH